MKCRCCQRAIAPAGNWIKVHLFGVTLTFDAGCFGQFLRPDADEELEHVAALAAGIEPYQGAQPGRQG